MPYIHNLKTDLDGMEPVDHVEAGLDCKTRRLVSSVFKRSLFHVRRAHKVSGLREILT